MSRNRRIHRQSRGSLDLSVKSIGSLTSFHSARKARQPSKASIAPSLSKQRSKIFSEGDADDSGSKSSTKFETDSAFMSEKPRIRVSQDPIRQSKLFHSGVFERTHKLSHSQQLSFVKTNNTALNVTEEESARVESMDSYAAFAELPIDKEIVVLSDSKVTSIPTNTINYFDPQQPTNAVDFITHSPVMRRLSLYGQQPQENTKPARRNSILSAWQNILPLSRSQSFMQAIRSTIGDTFQRLSSSSVEIAAYGSAVAPEPYLLPEQQGYGGDIPRSESVAVDDVENGSRKKNEGDENELLNDPSIAFLAYKVSRKNAFLHNHLLHAGSIDDLDMNMVLDTLYDQPLRTSHLPRSLQTRVIVSSSPTAVHPPTEQHFITNQSTE
jgi:hypothetical protein